MCFRNDYEWFAAQTEEYELISDGKTKCGDCYHVITEGDKFRRIDQYEFEECSDCGLRHEEFEECEDASPGEEFKFDMCKFCETLRSKIREKEEAHGCRGSEAEPGLPMWDEYCDDLDFYSEYVAYACEQVQEMAAEFTKRFPPRSEDDD